jgi:hypothetical protein
MKKEEGGEALCALAKGGEGVRESRREAAALQ